MPEAFEKCRAGGGKIRTVSRGKKYFHICIPKGGGKGDSVRGEMKTKKGSLKEARKSHG
jgi:hypothetical protein